MPKNSNSTGSNTREVDLIILKVFKHRKGQLLHEIRLSDLLKKHAKTRSLHVVSATSNMVVLCATKRLMHALIMVNMVILFEIAHKQRFLKHRNQMEESLGQGPKGECFL